MTLQRLTLGLFAVALAAAFAAPAAADQVFQNVSTGRLAPLPTPTGVPVYDAYYYPCYGSPPAWNGRGGRGYGRGSNSGTGTINGERFYPYDPRSTGSYYGHSAWNCYGGQEGGHHTRPRPRPQPSRIPLPNPPRRIPQVAPTPRS